MHWTFKHLFSFAFDFDSRQLLGDKSAGKTFVATESVAATHYKYKKQFKWILQDKNPHLRTLMEIAKIDFILDENELEKIGSSIQAHKQKSLINV